MAINSCAINSFTIDSLRCRRTHVPPNPVQSQKAHPYHTRIDPRQWQEHDEIDISKLEGPNILFTITIDGETHQLTVDNMPDNFIPLVTLNKLSINAIDDLPTFTISNLNMRPKQ